MRDNDPRSAPPIPPRRLKRKNKSVVSVKDEVVAEAATGSVRSERRPRIPPPPPPQRLPRRGGENSSKEICANKEKPGVDGGQGPLSTFGKPLGKGCGKKPAEPRPQVKKRDKVKIPRPEEYPPLFFTLQDFQEVMADVENSYSRTLKNMTTFEPIPRPRRTRISSGELPETPEREGSVFFRVTTTDLPFEKCRYEWKDGGDDPNHFVFEDYVDRRQKPAKVKPKLVLFGDDTFDGDDEDQSFFASHTASRVRFLVDSPETVSRDEKTEKITELDSLQNIDSLPLDFQSYQDEFGDVPFDSLLNPNNGDTTTYLSIEPSEDSTSSNNDFQTILVTATVEPVPLVDLVEKSCDNNPNRASPSNIKGGHSKDKEVCETEPKSFGVEVQKEEDKVEEIEKNIKVIEQLLLEFTGDGDDEGDKSVPEKLRRSSFLMNMLEGEEEESRAVCKVVATHPKTPIHKIEVVEDEGGVGNAVEAKSKLLGELSSSFSAIKLKPVNNIEDTMDKLCASDLKVDSMNGGDAVKDENFVEVIGKDMNDELNRNLDSVLDSNVVKCNLIEEPIEESRTSRNEPQDRSSVCSQKTDQPIIDKNVDNIYNREHGEGRRVEIDEIMNAKNSTESNEDNSGKINNNNNENNVELASVISVDKCAIVLQCNDNNDNNAMTPVDVSYDQSQNNVSIIPGNVRSFVKFYEIRGETSCSVGLNNDTALVPKIKVEAVEDTTKNIGEIDEPDVVTCPVAGIEIENDIKYTIVARRSVVQEQRKIEDGKRPQGINQERDKPDKSTKPSSAEVVLHESPVKLRRIDGKRDAQFRTGDDIKPSATLRETKTSGITEIRTNSASNKTTRVTQTARTAASGTASGTEDCSASGLIRDVVKPGTTIHSVPKSSTSTINERYTFYCTV